MNQEHPVPVHFRVRPLSQKEQAKGYFQTVYCNGSHSCIYIPSFQVLTDTCLDCHSFSFTGNHGPETSQEQFLQAFDSLVDWTLENQGVAACFAYGQTGSGKTYTMSAIASKIAHEIPYACVDVKISLLEILGEQIVDLITGQPIKILMDKETPVLVNVSQVEVFNELEAQEAIKHGFESRRTASTTKNATSSRSHFVCKIHMTDGDRKSELMLVDLAGSERHSDSQNHDPERLKESIAINGSLMALKDCIRARSDGEQRIPYRASKLTMVLKQVLAPGKKPAKAVMVATVSPTIADVSHSLNTFRYACSLNPIQMNQAQVKTTTPMAWKEEKIANWFQKVSDNRLTLQSIVKDDLKPRKEFVPPCWKFLYDLPEQVWIKRSPLKEEETLKIRELYRALFIKPRASVKAAGLTDGHVQTLTLVEFKRPETRKMSRHEESMLKAKAKGQAARKASEQVRKSSLRGF
ncbi:P-loop containing nucleoside triphosphate hydrolase protein [Gorgonomyces haynaldii]|nr:P-loop containing nucleoside triphosphate hydrolase protein [Gorgonomyces haynaldii]